MANDEQVAAAMRLPDASNALVLAPAIGGAADAACSDFLSVAPPAQENVLYVTFTQSPDDRIDQWHSHVSEERPTKMGIISVDDDYRSSEGSESPMTDGTLTLDTVSSPTDLTGLGMKISRLIADWEHEQHQTVACFNSLTTLLQYAELNRVFRFLHVLTGRLKQAEALAHYHMDPSAHEDKVINTLLSVFDAVVEIDESGERVVKSR